jgi:hypothetical protein
VPERSGGSEDSAAPGATDISAAETKFPRVAAMVKNGTSATALRGALAADPGLGQEIPA